MVTLRATVRANSRAEIEQAIIRTGRRRVDGIVKNYLAIADEQIRAVIEDHFITNRPAARRKAGTPRLVESFEARSDTPASQYPKIITIGPTKRAMSNAEARAKILTHTRGAAPHTIAPRGNGKLKFPWTGERASPYGIRSTDRAFHAYSTRKNARADVVLHPGQPNPVDIPQLAARRIRRRLRS